MLVQLSFQINSSDDSHLDSEISRGFICSLNALGGPVLESRHMREQEVPPHPKHTTHRAVKRTHTIKRGRKGREGKGKKKKKIKTSRVISCSSRSAFIYKTLGTPYFCSHPPALLMASSHHLFPFESTFPRTLASWHAVGKLKGKKVSTFWRKHCCLQSPREMSTAKGNEEEVAMRH